MSDDIKVLHVIDHMGLGGAQKVVERILSLRSSDKLFILRRREDEIKIRSDRKIYAASQSHLSLRNIFQLRKYIQNNNVQVVHIHLAKSAIYGFIATIGLHGNVKIVLHEHGEILQYDHIIRNVIYRSFLLLTRSVFSAYIAVSKYEEKHMKILLPTNKIFVIYNPINLEIFRRKNKSFPTRIKTVGYAGRLNKNKGWIDFIKLASLNSGLQFKIAGVGGDYNEIQEYIRKRDINNIELLGFIKDMDNFFSGIDVFVSCSRKESFGLSVVESMASEVPVIATEIPAYRELLNRAEDCMLLYKPGNLEELSKQLKSIENDKDLYKSLVKSGSECADLFSEEIFISDLNKMYSSLS